jgi:hypothetical protein
VADQQFIEGPGRVRGHTPRDREHDRVQQHTGGDQGDQQPQRSQPVGDGFEHRVHQSVPPWVGIAGDRSVRRSGSGRVHTP